MTLSAWWVLDAFGVSGDRDLGVKRLHDWQLASSYSSELGEVRWAELGDPNGEPLVLLHGTPFSSYIWRHIAGALANHRRVVPDGPGLGVALDPDKVDLYAELYRTDGASFAFHHPHALLGAHALPKC